MYLGNIGDMTRSAPDPLSSLPQHLAPELMDLLRHHQLLMPLLVRMVEESAVAEIQLDPSQRDQLMARWAGKLSLDQALEQASQLNGIRRDDVIWQIERPVKLAQLARERFLAKAEARFLERKNDLDQVTYSLIRLKDANLARELYLRLSAGEATFIELAQTYAEGPEKKTGGLVGPAPLSKAHPLLADRLRTAHDGEVMAPFAVAEWWLVVRRESFQPAVLDEAMSNRLAQELLREWVEEEAKRYRHQLLNLDTTSPADRAV